MKQRVTLFLTICLVAAASFVFAQTAKPPANSGADEAGTATNPYEIDDWDNLYWLSQNPDYWDAYFIQTADIDFGTASPTIQEWDDGKGWTPIGFFCPLEISNDDPFTGEYDGDGHSITGLFANRAEEGNGDLPPLPDEGHPEDPVIPEICPITSVGLFGFVDGAVIRNLHLEGVEIYAGDGSASLVVLAENSEIDNVSASGEVNGFFLVGGLIALADGCEIKDASSSVNIKGFAYLGGLVGYSLDSDFENSAATGDVTGFIFKEDEGPIGPLNIAGERLSDVFSGSERVNRFISNANIRDNGPGEPIIPFSGSRVGGFIGDAFACTIKQSSSTGDVQGGDETGGFAGSIANNTIIRESFSTSSVNGVDDVGGFIGSAVSGEIHDSYHRGDVEGNNNVGGFMGGSGFSTVTITFSYSAGAVNGTTDVNGFVGFFDDSEGGVLSIENSYWDVDTDGIPGTSSGTTNEGAIGKSTLQMQSILTFPAGEGWSMQEDPDIPRNYPLLTWQLDSNAKQRGTWTLGSGDPPAIPLSGWSTWVTLLLMSIFALRIALRKLL